MTTYRAKTVCGQATVPSETGLTYAKADEIIALWRTRNHDTFEIAKKIGLDEADVCRAIGSARLRQSCGLAVRP